MLKTITKLMGLFVLALAVSIGAGCQQESETEEAIEDTEEAIEDTGETIEDAGEDAADEVEETMD